MKKIVSFVIVLFLFTLSVNAQGMLGKFIVYDALFNDSNSSSHSHASGYRYDYVIKVVYENNKIDTISYSGFVRYQNLHHTVYLRGKEKINMFGTKVVMSTPRSDRDLDGYLVFGNVNTPIIQTIIPNVKSYVILERRIR